MSPRFGRFRDTVTLRHEAEGSRDDNGRWVPGASTSTTVKVIGTEPRMASGPVMAGRSQLAEVGGKRVVAGRVFWLYANTETVRNMIDGAEASADVMEWKGWDWIVVSVQEWRTHFQVMTVRRDDPPSVSEHDVALEDSVMRWVRAGSGVTTIPGNDPGPAPTGTYAVVDETGDRMIGTERTRIVDGNEVLRADAEATFRVLFYRDGAGAAAKKLRLWWRSEEGQVTARRGSSSYGTEHADHIPFTVAEASDVEDASMVVDDSIEERVYIDVRVCYHQVTDNQPRDGFASAGVIVRDGTHTETVDVSD